jgi:hypothetical protein
MNFVVGFIIVQHGNHGHSGFNPAGVVVGIAFASFMLFIMFRQWQQKRQVAARSVEYASQLPPESVAPHQWQAVDPTPYGFRTRPDTAQLPGWDRWIQQHQAYPDDVVSAAYATTLNGYNVVVFDNVLTWLDRDGRYGERTTCVRFKLPAPSPALLVQARNPSRRHRALMFVGSRPLPFESADFNQAYAVFATDEQGAFGVIDGAMMEWFLSHPMLLEFCIHDTDVLLVLESKDPPKSARKPSTTPFDPEYVVPFLSGFLTRLRTFPAPQNMHA